MTQARAPRVAGPSFPGDPVSRLLNSSTDVNGTITPGGAPVTITLASGEVGRLTFTGTTGQRVFTKFTGITIGSGCYQTVDAAILDSGGGTVASKSWLCTNGDYLETVQLPSDGTYTILITPRGTNAGSITTSLYDVPADPNPSLTPSQAGAAYTFATATPGQNAAPTFTVSAGQRIFVQFTNNTISTDCLNTVDTWIVKPDGSNLTNRVDLCQISSSDFIETVQILVAGTYKLVIDPEAALTGAVTATVYDVPPDPTPTVTPTPTGASYTFTTVTPGQNASVQFAGTVGQRVFAQFTNNTISTSCLYNVDAWFVRPDLSMIGQKVDTCQIPQSDFVDTTTLGPVAGTYALALNPDGALTGAVTATIYDVPPDVTGAFAIRGGSITATIATPGQGGTLTFTGGAGQQVKIAFTNNTISNSCLVGLRASLVKPGGGTPLAGPSTMCLPGDSLTATLPVDGTYTVVLDPGGVRTGSVTVTGSVTNAFQPPKQSFGTCGGSGVHALSPSECLADPVNSLTGAYTTSATDVSLPSVGMPLTFTRSYTSADPTAGRLGPGWTDGYSVSLAVQPNGDVQLHGDEGQQLLFARQSDGTFVGTAGDLSTLTQVGGTYKLVRHDQAAYQFDAQGRLTSLVDRNGQGVTLAYDGNGRLATVTDSAGHVATLTSNSDGTLAQISLPDGRTVVYGYTGGRLTSVRDPLLKTTTFTYDAGGRLATEVDPNNHTVVANTYDATTGRVTQQTDAVGKTTTFAWDAPTQTATITDPRNNVWKDVYSNNVLIKRIDPLGNTTQFGHDVSLDTTSVAAPDGSTTSMTYDANGNVLTATAPASLGNAKKTFTYDAKNNVATVTDARGKVTSYGYDASGLNPTSIVQAGVTVAQYSYDAAGQLLSSTDGNGKTTTLTYDANGNVASSADARGSKTAYTYDGAGRVLTRVDPLGNATGGNPAAYTTTYTYDSDGRLLTETNPLGNKTTNVYDSAGNKTSVTDANNHTTTYAYDAAYHLASVTGPDPDGAGALTAPITTYTYDAAGNRVTRVDPRGNAPGGNPALFTTTWAYDAANREISTTTPKGEKTTSTYDSSGNLASMVEARGNVAGANPVDFTRTYTYDAAGRMLTDTNPLNKQTTYVYDEVGNRISVTDSNSHRTSYTYDAASRVLTVTAPDTGVTTYTYDGEGNVLTRTDANGHVTSYTYDPAGNRASMTGPDPDGTGPLAAPVTTYSYDANDNLKTTTDPNGNSTVTSGDGTTTYTYDAVDRQKTIAYSDTTPGVTFGYDPLGNRSAMTDGSGSVSYVYDGLDRLTSTTRGTNTFSYAYDVAGNVTSRTYPDGTVTSYAYDEDNRLASAASGGATTTYAYDAAGHLIQTTLPAGNGYVETRAYDWAGRLADVKTAKGASILAEYATTRDPVGNPLTIARSGAVTSTTTYGYDANDRLTSACFQASCPGSADPFIRWTYDKVGNRLTEARSTGTTTSTFDNLDRMTKVGTTNYTYDQNGNETAAGSRTFAYNLANQVKSTTSGSTTTTYAYDGSGNRLQASTGNQAASKTNYLWDIKAAVPQLALERDGNNALLRKYLYGGRRFATTTNAGTYYYGYDWMGSVSNLTTATGTSEWTYAYEPFGITRTETKNDTKAPTNLMKFTGELSDPTGLYDLRARLYDPASGRFTRLDPVTPPPSIPSMSGYQYVADRPTVLVDPTGMTFTSCDDALIAVQGATSSSSSSGNRYLASSAARPLSCGHMRVRIAGSQLGPDDPFIHAQVQITLLTHLNRAIESYRGFIEVTAVGYEDGKPFAGVASPLQPLINVARGFSIPTVSATLGGAVLYVGAFDGTLAGGRRHCRNSFSGLAAVEAMPYP